VTTCGTIKYESTNRRIDESTNRRMSPLIVRGLGVSFLPRNKSTTSVSVCQKPLARSESPPACFHATRARVPLSRRVGASKRIAVLSLRLPVPRSRRMRALSPRLSAVFLPASSCQDSRGSGAASPAKRSAPPFMHSLSGRGSPSTLYIDPTMPAAENILKKNRSLFRPHR
jgi:hypothetical protein